MIGRLKGKILERGPDWVLLDVSGVGYKIFVQPLISRKLSEKEAIFYTHLYVREDMMNLYGFLKEEELELFELLISISGVGPKAALGVLSVGDVPSIKKAIVEGRSDLLMGVSGVGRKMADRIVLELKNKIEASGDIILSKALAPEDEDAVQALVNLGYKKLEASEAIKKASPELEAGQKVKEALRFLGK